MLLDVSPYYPCRPKLQNSTPRKTLSTTSWICHAPHLMDHRRRPLCYAGFDGTHFDLYFLRSDLARHSTNDGAKSDGTGSETATSRRKRTRRVKPFLFQTAHCIIVLTALWQASTPLDYRERGWPLCPQLARKCRQHPVSDKLRNDGRTML